MVPTTRSQVRNDNNNRTPAAAASVNNNPITTQNIIMVQTEAKRLAAIATVAAAAANAAAAAAAVQPVVLAAQPVVQPVIHVPIGPTYLLGSKLCDADVEAFFNSFQAMLPYMGAKKGSFFYGGVSPSKIGLIAPY
jgi:hypothetical protein